MENEIKWYENEKVVVPLIKETLNSINQNTANRKYATRDKVILVAATVVIVSVLCATIIWLAVIGAINDCTVGTLLAFICGTFAGRNIPRLFASIFGRD